MHRLVNAPRAIIAGLLTVTASAHAAISVNVFPEVTAADAVNPDGTVGAQIPIPATANFHLFIDGSAGTPAPPTFYEVHFYVTVTGADDTHSLGGVAFGIDGITRTSTFTGSSLGPGNPATPTQGLAPPPGAINTDDFSDFNSNPTPLHGSAFSASGIYNALAVDGSGGFTSEGFVVSPEARAAFSEAGDNDQFNLEAIAFSLKGGRVSSTQRTIGQSAPFDLGYVRLDWDQSHSFDDPILSVNDVFNTNDASLEYTVDTFATSNAVAPGTNGNVQIGPDTSFVDLAQLTPEPASLTLLALGLPILLRRRTHPARNC